MDSSVRERYSRQIVSPLLGPRGQERLLSSRVLVVGCGALGSVTAEILVRSGAGSVTVVDRDFLEWSNLQRQSLFTEEDVRSGLPKAAAAAARLRAINSEVAIEGIVRDVHAGNVRSLVADADLVLDGTDNFETRYLLNDAARAEKKPWVYAACIGAYAMALGIDPGRTACLRCVLPEPPEAGTVETCDTAGILAATVHAAAALECSEAVKILSGSPDAFGSLVSIDLSGAGAAVSSVRASTPSPDCPLCAEGRTEFLDRRRGGQVASLCGRDAVQVSPAEETRVALEPLADRLRPHGEVDANPFLLRFRPRGATPPCEIVLFPDGRAIVRGTRDGSVARSLLARFVGN